MEDILTVENLSLSFDSYAGEVHAVRGITFSVAAGEILALVGESGCGKSSVAQAVLGLHPMPPARIRGGHIWLCGQEVTGCGEKELARLRGRQASIIFQDAMSGLDPTMKVGEQVTEGLCLQTKLSSAARKREAIRLLELVRISDAPLCANRYPHQLSGGMRQRVMIAMALAGNPRLLIADEPTTALDTTIQLQILMLLKEIQQEIGVSILLITHNLGVVANLASRVAVMYAGKLVEQGRVDEVFSAPAHPYTKGLLACLPTPGGMGELVSIPGAPPDLFQPPVGCGFAPRCTQCRKLCLLEEPPIYSLGGARTAACWLQDARAPKETGV